MEMNYRAENRQLTISLAGELDHHAARALMESIDRCIEQNLPAKTILDLGGLTFMDSSGVGMIIGRYKTMHARGGSVAACGLQPPIDRLFHLAGLHRIIAITETEGRETHE